MAITVYLQSAKPSAVLVLALRGAEATRRVEAILGPRDPVLAKRTDPASVRAQLGIDRERNVAFLVSPLNFRCISVVFLLDFYNGNLEVR